MSYSISTLLVWRYFDNQCDCPLCKIKNKIESDLINLYLNEAVMEDDERHLVNKYGFCKDHFDLLYSGANKLGLALQMKTRLYTINKEITLIKDVKTAKKTALKLQEKLSTCLICARIDGNMDRYYKTICQMYNNEEKFRNAFKEINGLCLNHYASLLEYSNNAKGYSQEFLSIIYEKTKNYAENLYQHLDDFTFAFDYRSAKKPDKTATESLRKSRYFFYGEPPTPPTIK